MAKVDQIRKVHHPAGFIAPFAVLVLLSAAVRPVCSAEAAPPPSTKPAAKFTPADLQWCCDLVLKCPKTPDVIRGRLLERCARLKILQGDLDGALALAKEMPGIDSYAIEGLVIGTQQAAGDAAGAAKRLQQIKPSVQDEHYQTGLALAHARAGKIDQARAILAKVDSRMFRGLGYLELTRFSKDKKDIETAQAALNNPDQHRRMIAVATAWAGDPIAADKIAQAADDFERHDARVEIIRTLVASGRVPLARAVRGRIPKDEAINQWEAAWILIAAAPAKAGNIVETQACIANIKGLGKSLSESMLAYAQAVSGDLDAARQTAGKRKTIHVGQATGWSWGLIALTQLEKGDLDGARLTAATAKRAIESLDSAQDRADAAAGFFRAVIEGPFAIELTIND